jgi:hypothetical protein
MKKATITVSYDAEKLGAIKQYMGKKELNVEQDLQDYLEKAYEKHVPAPVREYIESREPSEPARPNRPSRPASSTPAGNNSPGGNP